MSKKTELNINQGKKMGASGNQTVNIDNRQNNHIYSEPNYKHLAVTHLGHITFNPESLREVILCLHGVADQFVDSHKKDFIAVDVEKKNEINGLTQDFYDEHIAVDFEPYFNELDTFIKLRANEDLQKKVLDIAKSLNHKIFIKREKFDNFESLILELQQTLIDEEFDSLNDKEDTVRLIFYYLYASCLIGKKTEGEKEC